MAIANSQSSRISAGPEREPQRRGRACWAEIDLGAIAFNCQALCREIGPSTELMAVVKANAYGHGISGIAETLVTAGASRFGVACVEEAVELRTAGVDAPILVLGYVPPWEADRVVRLDLTVALATRELAVALDAAARRIGRRALAHLKIDTGMSRFGVLSSELVPFAGVVAALSGIEVEAVFTHLATADEPELPLASEQLREFDRACADLARHGLMPPKRHALNSAGAFSFPEARFDIVRSGLMLYGLSPAPIPSVPPLRPALTLRARIARLRRLEPGTCVGYGCAFRAGRPTDLALLPIGYADGLSRALSNRGAALVNGRRVPMVGRISMDQCTIDVTDAGPLAEGDVATLLGSDGDETIDAVEMAGWRDTIPYEVLTSLSIRIPRLYTRDRHTVTVAENGAIVNNDSSSY
ncbi:MAG: alanine racemase [Chloroflexota bacterium]|nr:MAG: alanine racemase [Chloroflexota bacterium]